MGRGFGHFSYPKHLSALICFLHEAKNLRLQCEKFSERFLVFWIQV